jgi:hypothetical protein
MSATNKISFNTDALIEVYSGNEEKKLIDMCFEDTKCLSKLEYNNVIYESDIKINYDVVKTNSIYSYICTILNPEKFKNEKTQKNVFVYSMQKKLKFNPKTKPYGLKKDIFISFLKDSDFIHVLEEETKKSLIQLIDNLLQKESKKKKDEADAIAEKAKKEKAEADAIAEQAKKDLETYMNSSVITEGVKKKIIEEYKETRKKKKDKGKKPEKTEEASTSDSTTVVVQDSNFDRALMLFDNHGKRLQEIEEKIKSKQDLITAVENGVNVIQLDSINVSDEFPIHFIAKILNVDREGSLESEDVADIRMSIDDVKKGNASREKIQELITKVYKAYSKKPKAKIQHGKILTNKMKRALLKKIK